MPTRTPLPSHLAVAAAAPGVDVSPHHRRGVYAAGGDPRHRPERFVPVTAPPPQGLYLPGGAASVVVAVPKLFSCFIFFVSFFAVVQEDMRTYIP